jgi:hypothetical protein
MASGYTIKVQPKAFFTDFAFLKNTDCGIISTSVGAARF